MKITRAPVIVTSPGRNYVTLKIDTDDWDWHFADGYLALAGVLAVGGIWIAPPGRVAAGDWAGIARLARAAVTTPRGLVPHP